MAEFIAGLVIAQTFWGALWFLRGRQLRAANDRFDKALALAEKWMLIAETNADQRDRALDPLRFTSLDDPRLSSPVSDEADIIAAQEARWDTKEEKK